MWPAQTTERSEVMCISSESPVEILKALQTSRFKNFILGFLSEKGQRERKGRAQIKACTSNYVLAAHFCSR